jgi:hypothetical protein
MFITQCLPIYRDLLTLILIELAIFSSIGITPSSHYYITLHISRYPPKPLKGHSRQAKEQSFL